MGCSRQEHWRGLPCPSPGDLPDLESKPVSPAWKGPFFTTSTTREAPCLGLIECKMRVTFPELAVGSKGSVHLKCLAWCAAPGRPSTDGPVISIVFSVIAVTVLFPTGPGGPGQASAGDGSLLLTRVSPASWELVTSDDTVALACRGEALEPRQACVGLGGSLRGFAPALSLDRRVYIAAPGDRLSAWG